MVRRQSWSSCPNLDLLENLCTEGGKNKKRKHSDTLHTEACCPCTCIPSFFVNPCCVEERIQTPAMWPSPPQNQRTGAQESSRSAHPRPSASWICNETSVLLSCPRAPGLPGSLLCYEYSCFFSPLFFPPALNYLIVAYCYYCYNKQMSCFILHLSPLQIKGVRPLACPAGPHHFSLHHVVRALKVLLSHSLAGQRSRWPTWTTECHAKTCSRRYMTPSLDMVG